MVSPLNDREAEMLTAALAARRPDLVGLVGDLGSGRRLLVGEAEALQDAVVAELAASGVDPEVGAVNKRGVQLDRLIDRIAELSELNDP